MALNFANFGGPNYQSGQQGWQQGYGIALPMSSGDHMPFVSAPQSHPPPRAAMAPGQPQQPRMQQPQPQPQPGGGNPNPAPPSYMEPWNAPGFVQPTPTYNTPQWGTNAIGWGGTGSAPPMPTSNPPPPGQPPVAQPMGAQAGGTNGQPGNSLPWASIMQALSGMPMGAAQGMQPGAGGYTDPNFLNMLLHGLGGY